MSRPLRTYAGALYHSIWIYDATSNAEAGRKLFEVMNKEWREGTSPNAMSRYVGPVCWCPNHERFWFEMPATRELEGADPRLIYPRLIPSELWGGIEIRATESIDNFIRYGDNDSPVDVTPAHLLANVGIGCAMMHAADRVPFSPVWAKANDSAAAKIARQVRESGDFLAMPILADALEEAGCTQTLLLNHCRSAHTHVPGCWAVERVLATK